jgi:hypothetical protein
MPKLDGGAIISGGRRLSLWRRWGFGERWLYIGLNPSTAGAKIEDQSTRKMRGFGERYGAGSYVLMNLFDRRFTNPTFLYGRDLSFLCLPDNLSRIIAEARDAHKVVCIWGRHGRLHGQAERLLVMLRGAALGKKLYALNVNADGSPAHVLMLPYTCKPVLYRMPE